MVLNIIFHHGIIIIQEMITKFFHDTINIDDFELSNK